MKKFLILFPLICISLFAKESKRDQRIRLFFSKIPDSFNCSNFLISSTDGRRFYAIRYMPHPSKLHLQIFLIWPTKAIVVKEKRSVKAIFQTDKFDKLCIGDGKVRGIEQLWPKNSF